MFSLVFVENEAELTPISNIKFAFFNKICHGFLSLISRKFSGIGNNFPGMTFWQFPGNFPVGKIPGKITRRKERIMNYDASERAKDIKQRDLNLHQNIRRENLKRERESL